MIQLIGLIVAAYTLARCFAEITSREDGAPSNAGRIGYALCAIVTFFLALTLLSSGSSSPTPHF